MTKIVAFTKTLIDALKKDNITLLGAAQAYHYLLTIVPLLIACFAIVPYLNLDPAQVIEFLERTLPPELGSIFEENIVQLIETPKGGFLIFGIIAALWSASNGVMAFINAANEAYNVEETRSFIKVRSLAFLLTLGMIFSIIIAILFIVFGNVILNWVEGFFQMNNTFYILLQIARWIISILIITSILLVLYHFAPNKKIPFKGIIPGALTTSFLWLVISIGFSFYVGNFGNYSATYGSLGGIIILMIWFYLTGILLMIGAEINVILDKNKKDRKRADHEEKAVL